MLPAFLNWPSTDVRREEVADIGGAKDWRALFG